MKDTDRLPPLLSRIQLYFLSFSITWTLIIASLVLYGVYAIRQNMREMVKKEAFVHLNKDLASRLWATSHGGVYVPVTEKTPPNPFLRHIPDRDLKTSTGKTLTLMNPAYMIRQMMEYYADLYEVQGHITSLKYFRKETAPDDWERIALASFESGIKEVGEFTELNGKPYFRFMRPLITEEKCLKCHGAQGYKAGDIRGGVSVSVPIASYLNAQRKEILAHTFSLAILWFLGLSGVGFAVRSLKSHVREKEKAQYQHSQSQDNYSNLVESSLIGIYIIQEGIIQFANSRAAEIYGYSKEELVGMDALAVVHPEDRECVIEIRQKRLKAEEVPSEYEVRGIKKDGKTIWVQRRNTCCSYDGKPAILGNVLDITDLKKAQGESEDRSRELERSNRELDQFAAVASHDLSEPLRKIKVFGDLLLSKYSRFLDEKGKDYLKRMGNASERMQNMIYALLSYSRVTTKAQPFTQVNLADSVQEAISNLEVSIQRTGGKIQMEDLPMINGESSQMIQLFQNLIGNSLKFHRKEEPPIIRIRAQMVISPKNSMQGQNSPKWEIFVEDNGIGFDENQIERICRPFERLHDHDEYRGAGMGLAICRRIVERHEGTITATSTPGKGATFIITMPAE